MLCTGTMLTCIITNNKIKINPRQCVCSHDNVCWGRDEYNQNNKQGTDTGLDQKSKSFTATLPISVLLATKQRIYHFVNAFIKASPTLSCAYSILFLFSCLYQTVWLHCGLWIQTYDSSFGLNLQLAAYFLYYLVHVNIILLADWFNLIY